ncbi:hypothetical protein BO85DRAFT_230915 [Aspergillus piperis CBS 112811]|uniref:Uncharacterized protein n=1 Tax=Aspergillus piperis CBS 112811 TaxID=1448313 RepID=A0A8G1R999_9EURO|nr:hypothetical protein BO85DRAFT_230915 [Aspergillus piperis CBS 112811]RAH60569.1 hypothetical protein BO85DRAFT_230915 [Aspergillus piperis CBS 112811]
MVRPLRRLCDRMAFRWLRSRQTSRVGSTPFRACHPVWSIYPVWSLSGIFDIRLPPVGSYWLPLADFFQHLFL